MISCIPYRRKGSFEDKAKSLEALAFGVSQKKDCRKGRYYNINCTRCQGKYSRCRFIAQVATRIARNNWDINIFSSGIRHRKMLQGRDLTDDQIDSLIENADEHCFKRGISVQQFVNLVQEVAETLLRFDCSINTLPELIAQKRENWSH